LTFIAFIVEINTDQSRTTATHNMSTGVQSPRQQRSSSPTSAPTTDYALIESQKENIRPLQSGRSAAALSAVFSKETTAGAEGIAKEDETHRRLIEEAERRDKEGEETPHGVADVLGAYSE
jgi:checkpoint serine/threonine-protein kinase